MLAAQPEPVTFWEAVPDALLHRIMAALGCGVALARLRRVSRRCRRLADSDDLWRELCIARWNVSPASTPPTTWADVYAWNMQAFYALIMRQTADALRSALQRTAGVPIRLPGLGIPAFA